MKPTLRQLQYLVALADTGGFSAAARAVGVSQPSLSAQVKDMEAVLGATLVERGRRGAPLSPIGAELADRARQILRDMEHFRTAAREAGDTLAGTLRLGTLPSVGPYLLPPVLRTLHARFPALRFAIHEEATLDLQDGLRSGRLDAAISTRGDHPDMDALPLFEEALFIGVAPDDPLADPLSGAGAPIRVEALAGRQLLALGTRHRLGLLVRELASRAGAHVSADYQGTSLDAVRMMAEMGGAVAVMPSLYARQEAARDPGIVLRRVDDPAARRSVALFWRPGFPAPAKLRTVGGVMADMAASLLEGDSA